jgi:hypothetical protein
MQHRPRRFTPPRDIEDNGACFIIRAANGQALSYVYYESDPGRRTAARDEARRIAVNIAPGNLAGPPPPRVPLFLVLARG